MGGTEDGPSKHGGDNLRRKKDLCLGDPEAIFVTNVVITTRFTSRSIPRCICRRPLGPFGCATMLMSVARLARRAVTSAGVRRVAPPLDGPTTAIMHILLIEAVLVPLYFHRVIVSFHLQ